MAAIKEIKQFKRVFACNNRKFTTDDIYKFVRHKSLWGSIHKQASFPKRTIKKKPSVCSLSAEWWMIIISCEQRLHFHSVGKVPRSTFCKLANHKFFLKQSILKKFKKHQGCFDQSCMNWPCVSCLISHIACYSYVWKSSMWTGKCCGSISSLVQILCSFVFRHGNVW